MSIFDTVNPQAEIGSSDSVAYAPTAGFFEAFGLAYEAQVRGSSLMGLEYEFEAQDEEQAKKWGRTVDGSKVPRLRDVASYETLAKHFVDGEALKDEQLEALARYDDAVSRANRNGVDVVKARDLFGNVQKLAQRAERDYELTPFDAFGHVGGFTGGMIAAMDPRTDPLNFITLPIGGVGKSVAARIGSQTAAQGIIEGVNQLTGVQESRRLLGLEHGFAQGATQVLVTAGGAGVLQGIGEGLAAAGKAARRRWFSGPQDAVAGSGRLEEPPPPPPRASAPERDVEALIADYRASLNTRSPWSGPPNASVRTSADLDAVTAQLDDWLGPAPKDLSPNEMLSSTAIGRTDEAFTRADMAAIRPSENASQVDAIARQVDPELFRAFDSLADRKSTVLGEISRLQTEKAEAAQAAVDDISDEITALKAKMEDQNKRKSKKTADKIAQLEEERAAKIASIEAEDTPEIFAARQHMMQLDYKMRDLAPLVTRAYTKARGRWAASQGELEGVVSMIRDARTNRLEAERVTNVDPVSQPSTSPVSAIVSSRPDVAAGLTAKNDAADAMARVLEADQVVIDETAEAFRAAALTADVESPTFRLEGVDYEFRMDDKIAWPTDDGDGFQNISFRQVLDAIKEDDAKLKAMTTCSIRRPSQTAS